MKVVNVKTAAKGSYIYIGRTCGGFKGSVWQNPFLIGRDGDRDEVIRKYKVRLWRLMQDSRFKERLMKLDGKDLGCWCAPLACHGDVLIAAIAWMKSEARKVA